MDGTALSTVPNSIAICKIVIESAFASTTFSWTVGLEIFGEGCTVPFWERLYFTFSGTFVLYLFGNGCTLHFRGQFYCIFLRSSVLYIFGVGLAVHFYFIFQMNITSGRNYCKDINECTDIR